MKFFDLSVGAFAILLHTAAVSANPAPNPTPALLATTAPQATPNAWNFYLYKNKKCSGSAKNYMGTGSTDCRTDIHGTGEGFIRVDVDPRCNVTLYKDSKCSNGDTVGSISYDTADKCTASRKKKHIKSFKVTCS